MFQQVTPRKLWPRFNWSILPSIYCHLSEPKVASYYLKIVESFANYFINTEAIAQVLHSSNMSRARKKYKWGSEVNSKAKGFRRHCNTLRVNISSSNVFHSNLDLCVYSILTQSKDDKSWYYTKNHPLIWRLLQTSLTWIKCGYREDYLDFSIRTSSWSPKSLYF